MSRNRQYLQPQILEHDDSDEFIAVALAYRQIQKRRKRKRKHRWWVHEQNRKRVQLGAYHNLVNHLQIHGEKFQQYFRLTREQFAQVLFDFEGDLVTGHLSKLSSRKENVCE